MINDRTAFLICFASAWYHAPSTVAAGHITDTERAAIAAMHADRMVKALRECRPEILDEPPIRRTQTGPLGVPVVAEPDGSGSGWCGIQPGEEP